MTMTREVRELRKKDIPAPISGLFLVLIKDNP